MLFPLYFLTNASLAHLSAGLETRLVAGVGAQRLPVRGRAAVRRLVGAGRRSGPASGWHAPSLVPLLVALVLGLSSWPLVHELSLLLRQAGFTTLRPEHLERIGEAMRQWRAISPAFLVVVLAVVPALVEELFFRGFLMRALDDGGQVARAGRSSSAPSLFALFHLLVERRHRGRAPAAEPAAGPAPGLAGVAGGQHLAGRAAAHAEQRARRAAGVLRAEAGRGGLAGGGAGASAVAGCWRRRRRGWRWGWGGCGFSPLVARNGRDKSPPQTTARTANLSRQSGVARRQSFRTCCRDLARRAAGRRSPRRRAA